MELVLGVSMTPTTVSIALVEGKKADGVIVEHDAVDITAVPASATLSPSDHVIAAVLGTQEGALAGGHQLVSIGVTWTDHTEAAVLRDALIARGIEEDVLLVSELHAAAALAQAVGRRVGYDKTALMFVERDTATLAVVETADGSVVKVLGQRLHGEDATAVVAEMVTSLEGQNSVAQGLLVVGSGVDITAVKSHLQDLVALPVLAPEEPQLALARGAALASANAPRFDTSTIGLAYSLDPDDTTIYSAAYPMPLADGATALLGPDASSVAADIGADADDTPERSKPFLLMGSSLTAVFVVGMIALAFAMAINLQPNQDSDDMALHRGPPVRPPALESAPPAAPQLVPTTVPAPAQAAPPAAAVTAHLMVPPAPPPVFVRNTAPAPAAPPPAPAGPPLIPLPAAPPVIPLPAIQWLPPILLLPPVLNPGPKGHGGEGHGGEGHGGEGHGRGHGD